MRNRGAIDLEIGGPVVRIEMERQRRKIRDLELKDESDTGVVAGTYVNGTIPLSISVNRKGRITQILGTTASLQASVEAPDASGHTNTVTFNLIGV